MGNARKVLDRLTAAVEASDTEKLLALYAPDAVAVTPDAGEVKGREEIVEWMRPFMVAFPDLSFDVIAQHEDGDTAIDECYLVGTHTGPLAGPDGDIAPTGKRIHLRECDIAVVVDGQVREHRFYFDQGELLDQLGLTPA
jgi:predicted ester cyclase